MARWILFLLFFFQSLSAYKAVIFDFGEVIAQVDRKPILEFIASSLKIGKAEVKSSLKDEALFLALAEGHSYWEKFARSFNKELPRGWLEELEEKKKLIIQEMPGMLDLVSEIKKLPLQVAILSNTQPLRSAFIRSQGFYNGFHPVMLSCDENLKKPDPAFYQLMLQQLQLPAHECIFIDNKEKNVIAAKKLGLDAIHFLSSDHLKIELRKRKLAI